MTSTKVTQAADMFLGMGNVNGPGSVNSSGDDGFHSL